MVLNTALLTGRLEGPVSPWAEPSLPLTLPLQKMWITAFPMLLWQMSLCDVRIPKEILNLVHLFKVNLLFPAYV